MRATVIQMLGVALVVLGIGAAVGFALGFQFGAASAVTLAGAGVFAFGLSEED